MRCFHCDKEGHLLENCEERKSGAPSVSNLQALEALEAIAAVPDWEGKEHLLVCVRMSLCNLRANDRLADRIRKVRETFRGCA